MSKQSTASGLTQPSSLMISLFSSDNNSPAVSHSLSISNMGLHEYFFITNCFSVTVSYLRLSSEVSEICQNRLPSQSTVSKLYRLSSFLINSALGLSPTSTPDRLRWQTCHFRLKKTDWWKRRMSVTSVHFMIFQSSCGEQVMWYFFFFIASVMQHITVNWTLVLCLLTGGFTSDPDVWVKEKID